MKEGNSWRPKNWKKKHWVYPYNPDEIYEAGADEMLSALRAMGVKGYGNVVDGLAPAGKLVFIPEDY